MSIYYLKNLINGNWEKFIDFAFINSQYFSLSVYNWSSNENNYKDTYFETIHKMQWWEFNSENIEGEYIKHYFECNYFTKEIIKEVGDIYNFNFPNYPEDLCFYKENIAWFLSVTHEKDSYITDAFEDIIEKLKKMNLITK